MSGAKRQFIPSARWMSQRVFFNNRMSCLVVISQKGPRDPERGVFLPNKAKDQRTETCKNPTPHSSVSQKLDAGAKSRKRELGKV